MKPKNLQLKGLLKLYKKGKPLRSLINSTEARNYTIANVIIKRLKNMYFYFRIEYRYNIKNIVQFKKGKLNMTILIN